jgi:hypothetical protein
LEKQNSKATLLELTLNGSKDSPVINEDGNRLYWIGLYGMNGMTMTELVSFGRSWAYAPELSLSGRGYVSTGYDKKQRCYLLESSNARAGRVEFTLEGSKDSPVINPAIVVKNWNSDTAKILVNGKENKNSKVGINHQLDGDELVVYIPLKSEVPVKITVLP